MTHYTPAQPDCMDPWTPVTVDSVDGKLAVSVWGRTCRFDDCPLPIGIATAGREMLARPIRLVGELDGEPLEWPDKGRGVILHSCDDGQATVLGYQPSECGKVILNTSVRIEFDGAMFIDVKVMSGGGPGEEDVRRLTRLWLEVPLRGESAGLFHYWPQVHMGAGPDFNTDNSGAVPADGMSLPFKPFLWLGWEEGGLCWFAESDRDWLVADEDRAIEVLPNGEVTTLRLRLLDDEPPAWKGIKPVWRHRIRPLVFRMGFQATPVKPMPAEPLALRVGFHHTYNVLRRISKDDSDRTVLDALVERGINTVAFHEGWQILQNYGWPGDVDRVKQAVDACHDRGLKVWAYFGYELTSLAPEWGDHADDWLTKNIDGVPAGGWRRWPAQRDYIVCPASGWQDELVERITHMVEVCGFDGLYLDQTNAPFGCANESHGCGYRDADGELHISFPIRAARNVMKRLYRLMHSRGGHIEVHQSSGCVIPTMAFAHSYFDGEHLIWHDKFKDDPNGSIGLAAFRAEFAGRNFGIPAAFMAAPDSQAFPLLHGITNRPLSRHDESRRQVWAVTDKFRLAGADWQPYWRNASLLSSDHDMVKASAYIRRDEGRVSMLVIVANITGQASAAEGDEPGKAKTPPLEAKLGVNFDELGVQADSVSVVDAVTDEPLSLTDGQVPLTLGPLETQMLVLTGSSAPSR